MIRAVHQRCLPRCYAWRMELLLKGQGGARAISAKYTAQLRQTKSCFSSRVTVLPQNLPVLELEPWTPRPSARLTALQYSIGEPRWITDLDQGKQNSLPRS